MPANRNSLLSWTAAALILVPALASALGACSGEDSTSFLVVDVTTGLAPGTDFDTIRLDVFEGMSMEGDRPFDPVSLSVRSTDSFSPAFRLLDDGEQAIEKGSYLAELTLSKGAMRIESQRREFEVDQTTAISFNFSGGPACESPGDCGSLLSAACSAVDCVAGSCTCSCGSGTDAGCESIEICSNGIDDDGDDDIDCVDSDCEGRACDDGELCTINDVCGAGLCNAQPKDCAGADACKTGSCDPQSGACIMDNKPDGTLCDAHPNRCCSGNCVDLSRDPDNCGSCGIVCASERCDDLGTGRSACYCPGNASCAAGNVCYDPTGTGTHPDANHCDCDGDSDCGSGAKCAANVADAIDHCYYE